MAEVVRIAAVGVTEISIRNVVLILVAKDLQSERVEITVTQGFSSHGIAHALLECGGEMLVFCHGNGGCYGSCGLGSNRPGLVAALEGC